MKRLVILFIILYSTAFYGQGDSLKLTKIDDLNKRIEVEIDKEIFPLSFDNMYVSLDKKIRLMLSISYISSESMVDEFNKRIDTEGFEVLERKEFKKNGNSIFYLKYRFIDNDEVFYMTMYFKRIDVDYVLETVAIYPESNHEKLDSYIYQVALEAKIEQEN
jgi:hypothetical protein